MNPGGQIPHERVLTSMRLFTERVALRSAVTVAAGGPGGGVPSARSRFRRKTCP